MKRRILTLSLLLCLALASFCALWQYSQARDLQQQLDALSRREVQLADLEQSLFGRLLSAQESLYTQASLLVEEGTGEDVRRELRGLFTAGAGYDIRAALHAHLTLRGLELPVLERLYQLDSALTQRLFALPDETLAEVGGCYGRLARLFCDPNGGEGDLLDEALSDDPQLDQVSAAIGQELDRLEVLLAGAGEDAQE